uniref:Uncharacterized protein n=1 Tax=Pithovirus LCPAC202 TaxID=2506592 RepID=A0A481Z853_9VIRU|nr:MAG: hypothetical protein LCPAC202_02840 [Pithovirus LCPAC202]
MSNNQIPLIPCPVLKPPRNLAIPIIPSAPILKGVPKLPKKKISLTQLKSVSPHSKIIEVLKFGNIYAAMKAKYLSGSEVMTWLRSVIKNSPKITPIEKIYTMPEILIRVYRAVCIHASEEVQLDSHDKHFLDDIFVDIRSYRQIYILTHLSRKFYGALDSILGCEAIRILQEKYSPLVANCSRFLETGKIGLTRYPLIFFINHQMIPKGEIIEKEILLNCVKHAVNEEYFEYIHKYILTQTYKNFILTKIIRRSTEIKKSAPNYWNAVTKKGFMSILTKLNLDLSQKAKVYQLYPELCPELSKLSPLGLKIMTLKSSFLRGYLLGFPIERYLPKDEELLKAATNLSKLGLKGYEVFLRLHNQRKIKNICQHPELPSGWYIPEVKVAPNLTPGDLSIMSSEIINVDKIKKNPFNDTNLSEVDKITDFSPFDRISVQSGNGFHFFTRSSFVYLLKTKKNPYNKQLLDPGTLVLLEDRIKRAKLMRLPECKTLFETLELFQSDQLTTPRGDQQITSARPSWLREDPLSIQNLAPVYFSTSSENTPLPVLVGSLMDALGI